jgi:hypothetical protein
VFVTQPKYFKELITVPTDGVPVHAVGLAT